MNHSGMSGRLNLIVYSARFLRCHRNSSAQVAAVAEDDAMRIAQVVVEDLAGQLQRFALVDRVLVRVVSVVGALPENAESM